MRIENLTVSFGERKVLNSLSLTIPESGIIMISAPSGFGKTTLLRAVAGIITPDSGSIDGFGRVGYAFQEPRLLPWLSAVDNVTLVREKPDESEALCLLERLGLGGEDALKKARSLSGGMKQRVNIARALYYDCDTLLLDEPFSGLDREKIDLVVDLLKERAEHMPVIVVSHVESDADWAEKHIRLDELQ